MHQDDIPLYGQFTALNRNGLQTWVAVGGWSFNDPGSTHTAFSDMVSSAANRAAFITSVITFMETYGFQGADLDWEYPSDNDRGGQPADADNLVLLVKEMKTAFAGRFGLSLTLAPDYWYLRGFKPAEMQGYVDFMGFMAYDLHGPWDTDVETLGSKVCPQTDITEMDRNMKPLWFDGVDPSKIVMGIAYYGQSYKLSDPSCGTMGCPFQPGLGGSPGSCTNFPGVLSNREIQSILSASQGSITPTLNETAMVKYFTYDGDSWSIDFDPETGGGGAANPYRSPDMATVIPLPHTTVPAGATLTVDSGVSTDVISLSYDGNQNIPQGPGSNTCQRCSFFRLITSTCCGDGGSIGNPIELPANIPIPLDIILPAGFVPNQPFVATDGSTATAGSPLPRELTIPKGTVFSSPFIIPPGQPLREGEDDDTGDDAILWIDPAIWDDPNPTASCYPPCTLVLPPWTKVTSTVDYPRITWTEGQLTTVLTVPPITISEWQLETVVVGNQPSSSSSGTGFPPIIFPIITPILSATTTWPPVTTILSGHVTTITNPPVPPRPAPPGPPPHPPPAPGPWPPPIRISIGPSGPIVRPCAFPANGCPGKVDPGQVQPPGLEPTLKPVKKLSGRPPTGNPSDPNRNEDEDPDNEGFTPVPEDPGSGGPTVPPPNTPNPSTNTVNCYNRGQWTRRSALIDGIAYFCDRFLGYGILPEGKFVEENILMGFSGNDIFDVVVTFSVEVKSGCQWVYDVIDCRKYLEVAVDSCDCDGTKHKQGGVVENNCLKWRLDPTGYNLG
ncbi:hypothetical protein P152DRAFT_512062 [Eremomyces bilateralis CBS 781.70]|uniref:chitinase n=1 Tax=Eremomyces bilateralis CBS 781.70 TaxID=1392243 RepID=A0A6G1G9V4_9PEZI|nr:uncharacterized protein P152DRAFT_512062 [Eremomyces bilateralis CBS 781.70]KAF1814690.1 hypothetical protein P152DRAFT_512062 [Eremomyces bilateralis CBS 781.70]